MLEPFVIGNLLGRLFISAALVFVVLLILNRLDIKSALKRLRHPLSITAIFVLFVLGVSINAQADAARAERPFIPTEFIDARLLAYVPERPKWNAMVEPRSGTYALILSTPEKYYPPTSLEIVHNHRLQVPEDELQNTALSALREIRLRSGVEQSISLDHLQPVTHGQLTGYQDEFTMSYADKAYSIRSLFVVFENRAPVTIFLATPKGQTSHIDHMAKKMFRNLSPLG